jgi:hypothetical protein
MFLPAGTTIKRTLGQFFERRNFDVSPGMATPFKRGIQPDFNQMIGQFLADQITRQTQHVQIVVPTAHFGRNIVVAWCGTHAGEFVGHNAHANARPAHQYAAIDLLACYFSGNERSNIGIIYFLGSVGSHVNHILSKPPKKIDQLCPQFHSTMIASDRNSHHFLQVAAKTSIIIPCYW